MEDRVFWIPLFSWATGVYALPPTVAHNVKVSISYQYIYYITQYTNIQYIAVLPNLIVSPD